ncbi:MAG: tetratricopeptide repeat protein [Bacteroidales bacterium]
MKQIKTTAISLLLILSVVLLFGQSAEEVRSLEKKLQNTSGKERMLILQKLASVYSDSLSSIAIGYNTQYLKLAELYSSVSDQAKAYSLFGSIYQFQLDYQNALLANLKALRLFKSLGDSMNTYILCYQSANSYLFLHQFDSAMYYVDQSVDYYIRNGIRDKLINAEILQGKILTMSYQNDKAVSKFLSILREIEGSNDYHMITWIQYWLGQAEMNAGNFPAAIGYLKSSIENYRKINNYPGYLGSMLLLGKIYQIIGNNARAYEIFFESYKYREHVKGDLGKQHFLTQYLLNMGNIFMDTDNYREALIRFDSAEVIARRFGFENQIAEAGIAKGRMWFREKKYQQARQSYEEAYAIFQENENPYNIARTLNNLAGTYQYSGQLQKALDIYQQALQINKSIGNKFGEAQNYHNMATCYLQMAKFKAAKDALDAGIEQAKFSGVKNLVLKYYRNYIDCCDKSGDHADAHGFFNDYLLLSTRQQEESARNMTRLLLSMHENELQAATTLLNQKLAIEELNNERNSLYLKQIIGFGGFILTILVLITYLYINKYRTARKLEMQVADRTRTLQENEQKLIEINRTRDRFYSIIAHDLKSPFNSLIGFSNLLHDEYPDFSDKERLNFIEIIRNSSEEIYVLLENLLDWTRNSSHQLQVKQIRIDLSRVTRQILLLQEKNAEMKNISVINNVPKNTFAIADENMIRTVIRNLLSNAIKFTEKDGRIVLDARQYDSVVEYSVQDNGIGISAENLTKLFSADSNYKKKGTANERGTGLGLLLCRDFISKIGGDLRVSSEPGKGSTFSFTLPIKKTSDEQA